VRSRIFEVLRFGTPMAGGYESTLLQKNNGLPARFVTRDLMTQVCRLIDATILDSAFLDL
jgi:hypothetical protein